MPLLFVPARSSRHRRACFALYRALVRQGQRVPLPAELSTESPLGPAHPIKPLIRNAFRRNKHDISPRLVVSALKNGYRYLTLLSRAADTTTPEHTEVLTFLRENQARVLALREKGAAAAAAKARLSTAPYPPDDPRRPKPLIRKTSPPPSPLPTTLSSLPGTYPQQQPLQPPTTQPLPIIYTPAVPPRPLSSFPSGVRKPPTLGAVNGVPFLRLGKPMPRFLERVVRQKAWRRQKRILFMVELQDEPLEQAKEEDLWEKIVGQALAAEGEGGRNRKGGEEGKLGGGDGTYRQTLWDAVVALSEVTERERMDLTARGRAMWQFVLQEQEQALEEERARLVREGKDPAEAKLRDWRRPLWTKRKGPSEAGKGGQTAGKKGVDIAPGDGGKPSELKQA